MDVGRRSILERADIDVRKLSISSREAFVLSQLDGQLTLVDVADLVGLDFDAAAAIAARLVDVGAATIANRVGPRHRSHKSLRIPRVVVGPTPQISVKTPPRLSTKPPRLSTKPPRLSTKPPPRRASKSHALPEMCELDPELQKAIVELDARVLLLDHYGRLGIERTADKKTIKRAYFALASKFHPDRFFGKKLGPLEPTIDRVFRLTTDAHDTLVDAERRAKYDQSLEPTPKPKPKSVAPKPRSIAPKAKSIAPTARSIAPRNSRASRSPSRKMKAASFGPAATPPPMIVPPPPAMPNPIPPQSPTLSADRLKTLLAGAREVRTQQRADMLVQAAEEAISKGDVIGASNNYRLALEHREDPYLRSKLEDVERLANGVRLERHLTRARAAEKDKRWADAAVHFEAAFACKRDAAVAERAAASLHLGGGSEERALELAEIAVAMRGGNVEYRITLAEIALAMSLGERAAEHLERALELAPKDPRVKALTKLAKIC